MSIAIGQTVIHPAHGAVTVERRTERSFDGEAIEFVVLGTDDGLTVMVPVDQLEEIGIRDCMAKKEVKAILAVLSDEPSKMTGHWSRRLKQNKERFRSGDPTEVASVVRDLAAKDGRKGLSPAERRLFRDARRMIEGELAAVVKGGQDAAERKIDDALAVHLLLEEEAAE